MKTIFIIPSLSCNANCKYCYISHKKTDIIKINLLKDFLQFIEPTHSKKKFSLCFHGGEPLLAGLSFYKEVIPYIFELFGDYVRLSIQSNLFLLNQEFLNLFKEYNVGIGSSLDGPKSVNDFNRGIGYYKKNINGIQLCKKNNIDVNIITTISKKSKKAYSEIEHYFKELEIKYDIHPAIQPPQKVDNEQIYLSPKAFAKFLKNILPSYISNKNKSRIRFIDSMINNIQFENSRLCTFSECIGEYISLTPNGDLYPCTRLVGHEDYKFCNFYDIDFLSDIKNTLAYKKLNSAYLEIKETCSICDFWNLCHGGCISNALYTNLKPLKDPYCIAYKTAFNCITDYAVDSFFKEENFESFKSKMCVQSENKH